MASSNPTKKQLRALAQRIEQDQAKLSPAEKRVKINGTFKNAVKKTAQAKPSKKN